jgi:hypothetical protein
MRTPTVKPDICVPRSVGGTMLGIQHDVDREHRIGWRMTDDGWRVAEGWYCPAIHHPLSATHSLESSARAGKRPVALRAPRPFDVIELGIVHRLQRALNPPAGSGDG